MINGLLQIQGLDGGLQWFLFGEKQDLEGQFLDGPQAALQDRPGGVIAAHAINSNAEPWAFGGTAAASAGLPQAQRAQGGIGRVHQPNHRAGAAIPNHQALDCTAGPRPPGPTRQGLGLRHGGQAPSPVAPSMMR